MKVCAILGVLLLVLQGWPIAGQSAASRPNILLVVVEEVEHDPFNRGFEKAYALLQGGASHGMACTQLR